LRGGLLISGRSDGSIITLTGHVRTWAEHDAVVGAAWMARGVIDVDDELEVTGWPAQSRGGWHGGSAQRGHHDGCAGEPGVATAGRSAAPGGAPGRARGAVRGPGGGRLRLAAAAGRVLAALGAKLRFRLAADVVLASIFVSHLTPFGSAAGTLVNVGTLEADGIEAATTGEAIALTSLMSTVALDQGALPGHGQAAAGAAG